MHDKRKTPRKKAPEKVTVYDRATDNAVGQVVNMSTGGLLLLSDSPIPVDNVYQFRIMLPDFIDGTDSLNFGVESLWGSPAMDENYYWTGFQIIDISESDSRILEILIKDWRS